MRSNRADPRRARLRLRAGREATLLSLCAAGALGALGALGAPLAGCIAVPDHVAAELAPPDGSRPNHFADAGAGAAPSGAEAVAQPARPASPADPGLPPAEAAEGGDAGAGRPRPAATTGGPDAERRP